MNIVIIVISTILIPPLVPVVANKRIHLGDDGKYKNIVIAIDETIKQNNDIINRIKEDFTSASEILIRATKKLNSPRSGQVFGDVYILLPSSWNRSSIQEVKDASWQWYSQSPFRITTPNLQYGHRPYTVQLNGCGNEGIYTHFTPEFFLNKTEMINKYKDIGKVIVHEWAHLRWGVMDEAPQDNEPHFYVTDGKIFPVRCTARINGVATHKQTGDPCKVDPSTKLPEKDCIFVPHTTQSAQVVTSLMSYSYVSSINRFCDTTDNSYHKHNKYTPSKQNRFCNKKSVWEILQDHEDFKKNIPKEIDYHPTFHVVQAKKREVVLVLDLSGSMVGRPLEKLKQAVRHYISSDIEDTASVGIVLFSTGVTILSSKLQVGAAGSANRRHLVDLVETMDDALGVTDIGDGIVEGINVLNRTNGGGYMFLVSDGEENRSSKSKYNFTTAAEMAKNAGVTVDVLALGNIADKRIRNLAESTGGKFYHAAADDNSLDLVNSLLDTVTDRVPDSETAIILLSTMVQLRRRMKNAFTTLNVAMDTTSNGVLLFYVQYDKNSQLVMSVVDPNGKEFNQNNTLFTQTSTSIFMFLKENEFKAGTWKVIIQSSNTNSVALMVTSNVGQQSREPIILESSIDNTLVADNTAHSKVIIQGTLRRGTNPVLGANAKATIDRPTSDPITINLYDDGTEYDSMRDDGIYTGLLSSRYFNMKGEYSVTVHMNNQDRVRTDGLMSRKSTAGSFYLETFDEKQAGVDRVPPSVIEDVTIISTNSSNSTIDMTWTAVGDDYKEGQAKKYTIRWSTNYEQLTTDKTSGKVVNKKQVIKGDIDNPRQSGQLEQFTIKLNTKDKVVYVAVHATDVAGNNGTVNYPVAAAFQSVPFGSFDNNDNKEGPTSNILAIVIGTICAVIVIIAIVAGAVFKFRR